MLSEQLMARSGGLATCRNIPYNAQKKARLNRLASVIATLPSRLSDGEFSCRAREYFLSDPAWAVLVFRLPPAEPGPFNPAEGIRAKLGPSCCDIRAPMAELGHGDCTKSGGRVTRKRRLFLL
jgi:hypothetical protein